MQRRWKGVVEDHVAMKSSKKGTPGIEFRVTVREKQVGRDWKEVQWFERSVVVWFSTKPAADHSWSIRKLAYAGYDKGTHLSDMDLRGKTVELVSSTENLDDGTERERYDLALPPRGMSDSSDDAGLVIDAILSSAAIESVKRPTALDPDAAPDPDAEPAGSVTGDGAGAASRKTKRVEAPARDLSTDDVPF